MVKLTTKSGQVYNTEETFETIQRAMVNKTLLELKVGDRKIMINPDTIESIDAPKDETNSIYKQNAGRPSNFPFQMTQEETEAMQNKLQPMKFLFDMKKEAMIEMKKKEDAAIINAYAKKYGGYLNAAPAETTVVSNASPEVSPEFKAAVEAEILARQLNLEKIAGVDRPTWDPLNIPKPELELDKEAFIKLTNPSGEEVYVNKGTVDTPNAEGVVTPSQSPLVAKKKPGRPKKA